MSKIRKFSHHDQDTRPPYRKVFMITEKSTDDETPPNATTNGIKRKMLLILDEKPKQQQEKTENRIESQQQFSSSNFKNNKNKSEHSEDVAPKLFLFANNVDNQISQKIESLLPEILNRFQWKSGGVVDVKESNKTSTNNNIKIKQQQIPNLTNNEQTSKQTLDQTNGDLKYQELLLNAKNENANNNENLMLLGAAAAATAAYTRANKNTTDIRKITLPPKKNHSKLQKQLNISDMNNTNSNILINSTTAKCHLTNDHEVISAATPVIVSMTSLKGKSNNQQEQQPLHVPSSAFLKRPQHQQQYPSYQSMSHQNSSGSINHFCHNGNNNKYNSSNHAKPNNKNSSENSIVVQQQNINLTGDFLFLMKMLPILEKTPEPRKSQVKMLIEKIMRQCGGVDNDNNIASDE